MRQSVLGLCVSLQQGRRPVAARQGWSQNAAAAARMLRRGLGGTGPSVGFVVLVVSAFPCLLVSSFWAALILLLAASSSLLVRFLSFFSQIALFLFFLFSLSSLSRTITTG